MTPEGQAALRQALTVAGFDWLPEITAHKFTSKEYADWRDQPPFAFDPALEYRNQYGPLLNTAIRLTHLWAWDFDIDDQNDVTDCTEAVKAVLGEPLGSRHRAGSPRTAYLYRQDTDAAYSGLEGSDGAIEVFSGCRAKLTAFGLHANKVTGERTRLLWHDVPGNRPLDTFPVVTEDQILDALAACGDFLGDDAQLIRRNQHDAHTGTPLADDIDELCRALTFIPNHGVVPWQESNRIGMAMFAGSGGDERALVAYAEWCLSGAGTKHRDWFARWTNYACCPPTAIGAGTIFHLAAQHGYIRPLRSGHDILRWREQQNQMRRNKSWKPKI